MDAFQLGSQVMMLFLLFIYNPMWHHVILVQREVSTNIQAAYSNVSCTAWLPNSCSAAQVCSVIRRFFLQTYSFILFSMPYLSYQACSNKSKMSCPSLDLVIVFVFKSNNVSVTLPRCLFTLLPLLKVLAYLKADEVPQLIQVQCIQACLSDLIKHSQYMYSAAALVAFKTKSTALLGNSFTEVVFIIQFVLFL